MRLWLDDWERQNGPIPQLMLDKALANLARPIAPDVSALPLVAEPPNSTTSVGGPEPQAASDPESVDQEFLDDVADLDSDEERSRRLDNLFELWELYRSAATPVRQADFLIQFANAIFHFQGQIETERRLRARDRLQDAGAADSS